VEGIPRVCQGVVTPVSLGYSLSLFNKNSTLKERKNGKKHTRRKKEIYRCLPPAYYDSCGQITSGPLRFWKQQKIA